MTRADRFLQLNDAFHALASACCILTKVSDLRRSAGRPLRPIEVAVFRSVLDAARQSAYDAASEFEDALTEIPPEAAARDLIGYEDEALVILDRPLAHYSRVLLTSDVTFVVKRILEISNGV